MVPFRMYFWIQLVFPFVIYSSIFFYSNHLLSWKTSLSWMDINLLKPEPLSPSWPGFFDFRTFLNVALSDSCCIFESSNSFSIFLSHLLFCLFFAMFFLFPYFTPVCFCFLCIRLCILQLFVGRIFFCYFGRSCLVGISWFSFCIFKVCLLSTMIFLLFYLFKVHCQSCLLFCSGLYHFSYACFSFLNTFACHNFFTSTYSLIYNQSFAFLFWFFRGNSILQQIFFILHTFPHLFIYLLWFYLKFFPVFNSDRC